MHKLTEQQRHRVAEGKSLVEQMIADTEAGKLKVSPYLQDKFDSETGPLPKQPKKIRHNSESEDSQVAAVHQ